MSFNLPKPVADFIDATNAFDIEGFMRPLADDALVNDRHRQFWGKEAIRRWCEIEIVGDHVTLEVRDVVEHYGDVIVTAKVDGDYDKSDLPPELFLAFYMAVRGDKIVQIILLPLAGRKLSKATETSEAATPFAAAIPNS